MAENENTIAEQGVNPNSSQQSIKFLTFNLGNAEYAVDIMIVKEIRGWSATTRLPNANNALCGVINLRGNIVPIFDLKVRFGQEGSEPSGKNVFIIFSVGNRTVGVVVDAVSDILDVTSEQIKQSPTADTELDDKYISGLISLEQRMVIVLDMAKLFCEEVENLSNHDPI